MQRVAQLSKRIYNSDYFPFLVLLFFMGIIHCFIGVNESDDLFFSWILDNQGIGDYLAFRYLYWTSRLLIEAVLVVVVRHTWLWRILDLFVVMVLALSLSKLVDTKRKRATNYLICLGFLIYPFIIMSSAGWGATTVNYLWPAAACAFALIPFKKAIYDEPISVWLGVFSVLATAFAANAEQCAVFLAVVLPALNIYLRTQKKARPLLLVQAAVAVLGLVFILTCPGNANRTVAETARWYPGYAMLGFWDKAYLGIARTAEYIFSVHNRLFLLLCAALLVMVWKKHRGWIKRLIAVFPFLYSLFANIPVGWYQDVFPRLTKLLAFGFSAGGEARSVAHGFAMAFAMLSLCFVCVSLFHVYGKTKKSALMIFIFLAGLSSSIMLGFSPTVYASGLRTFFNTDMVFLALGCWLMKDLLPELTARQARVLYAVVAFLAAASFFYTFNNLLA